MSNTGVKKCPRQNVNREAYHKALLPASLVNLVSILFQWGRTQVQYLRCHISGSFNINEILVLEQLFYDAFSLSLLDIHDPTKQFKHPPPLLSSLCEIHPLFPLISETLITISHSYTLNYTHTHTPSLNIGILKCKPSLSILKNYLKIQSISTFEPWHLTRLDKKTIFRMINWKINNVINLILCLAWDKFHFFLREYKKKGSIWRIVREVKLRLHSASSQIKLTVMDSGKVLTEPPIFDPLKLKPNKSTLTRGRCLGSLLGDLLLVTKILLLFSFLSFILSLEFWI